MIPNYLWTKLTLTDNWVKKMWYTYTMEWYSAIRKDEILPFALAGVAQWTEHGPVNQRVTGSIPSQGTYLGYGSGPQVGGV